jgi:hypothetical protein
MKSWGWIHSKTRVLLFPILALAGTGIYLRSQSPAPAPISMPAAESYMIIVGTQDSKPTAWNGCITITTPSAVVPNVLGMTIWRQGPKDSVTISGTTPICPKGGSTFQLMTIDHSAGATGKSLAENGVILTMASQGSPFTFALGVTNRPGAAPDCSQNPLPTGCYTFSSADLPFGTPKRFPEKDPKAGIYAARTASPLQLTGPYEDEDFPAVAQSGDDVWVAYIQFKHNQPLQQQPTVFGKTLPSWVTGGPGGNPNFAASPLARPAGGDRVFAMHYSVAGRMWTGPYPITDAADDTTMMRTAIAVDGQKRAWIFYSVERNGNFDLYARRIVAGGTVSAEVQLTTNPGADLNPVATTDSSGHVWVAWQGFRNGNLEILVMAQAQPGGNVFSPESVVSTSPASDWDPAIAAGASGEVAISWDTYDKGDYDVYLRRASLTPLGVSLNAARPVAASLGFEARSSIVYDAQNRIWIAYETADVKWGKDFGALDTSGVNLYQNHNIAVRAIDGADQKAVMNDNLTGPNGVLPGPPNTQFFTISPSAPSGFFPDPTLAANRPADGSPSSESNYPKLPNNSVPRIAVDANGTVYLAFRTKAGGSLSSDHNTGLNSGDSVGSIWIEQMVYFDGQKWNGPGVIAQSDGLLDLRPTILPLDPGHVLIVQATDHRLSPAPGGQRGLDPVNSDIYAAELTVQPQQITPPQLVLSPAVVDPQSPDEKNEAAQVALLESSSVTVGGQTYQVKRGDFHRHTEFSFDGGQDGSIDDAYRYMIDAAPLDWGGCCDHDNGAAREYSWWNLQKYTEAYLLPGRYTPLFNFERSLNYPEGHRNAIFAQRGRRPLPRLPSGAAGPPCPQCPPGSPDTYFFYQYLHYFAGLDAAHTVATDQGNDWSSNDPAVETTVEIYQGDRQSYERVDSPRSNAQCDSIDEWKPLGYVSAAIKSAASGGKGYMLGFESSSDHRSTHISYTNVWLTDPSRQGTLDAISKRRVYASTDLILADVRMGAHFMGEAFTWPGKPTLTVVLQGANSFQQASVVKDSVDAFTTSTKQSPCPTNPSTSVCFTWQDNATLKSGEQHYYYIRGLQDGPSLTTFTCETNPRTSGSVVWTSPMWVTEE